MFLLERRKKCQKKTKNMTVSAWKLIPIICTKLIDYIKISSILLILLIGINNQKKDFTRKSKLTFQTILLFLGNFRKWKGLGIGMPWGR